MANHKYEDDTYGVSRFDCRLTHEDIQRILFQRLVWTRTVEQNAFMTDMTLFDATVVFLFWKNAGMALFVPGKAAATSVKS